MLRAILNKSWRQHPTRHQLYGHLPPITKTIQVRRTRHAGHCWRSKDELISDVLLWTPTYGQAKAGRPTRTYIQQLCEDTGCSPEDLPEGMNDREKWRERVMDIRASSTTWWWWWLPGTLSSRLVVLFEFSSIVQIDVFSIYLYLEYLKSYYRIKKNFFRNYTYTHSLKINLKCTLFSDLWVGMVVPVRVQLICLKNLRIRLDCIKNKQKRKL